MGREFELKYQAGEGVLERLREEYGPFREIRMETTYYDDAGKNISLRRWTLRRRLENGVSVCTVKTALPDGSRGEWETEAADVAAAIPRLIALGAPAELAERYSNEKQVTDQTPRAFIALSDDDNGVPPANSIGYYSALKKHNVPAELHVYPSGGHGWGWRDSFEYHDELRASLGRWLEEIRK